MIAYYKELPSILGALKSIENDATFQEQISIVTPRNLNYGPTDPTE